MEAHREGQGSMVVQIIGSHGGRRTDFSFKTLREPIKLTPDLTLHSDIGLDIGILIVYLDLRTEGIGREQLEGQGVDTVFSRR